MAGMAIAMQHWQASPIQNMQMQIIQMSTSFYHEQDFANLHAIACITKESAGLRNIYVVL